MKKILVTVVLISIIALKLSAQSWQLLNRQQKDSVIYSYHQKGHKYISFGAGFSGAAGQIQGSNINLEPAFGFFFKNRNMMYLSVAYEQAVIKVDTFYRKHKQYSVGAAYRYYLPERKTYSSFYIQAGLKAFYFTGTKNEVTGSDTIDFFDLLIPIELGISIPINKFNMEIGLTKKYRLFNAEKYENFYAGTTGIIRVSYIFK